MGFRADEQLLASIGVDNHTLDAGCCGLAGNFGFEPGHDAISRACGERVLLPAVRAADPDTLVLADGFSCRTQIAQETGREAIHLAELLRMALAADAPR
jgi:Fe-S oxidoreductase